MRGYRSPHLVAAAPHADRLAWYSFNRPCRFRLKFRELADQRIRRPAFTGAFSRRRLAPCCWLARCHLLTQATDGGYALLPRLSARCAIRRLLCYGPPR